MKNRAILSLVAGLSIAVIPITVKAQASEKKASPDRAQKSDLKDSVKDASQKSEIAQLVDFLAKSGHDITIAESLAPIIGLPGARPAKSQNIRNKIHGKDRDALNCAVIYEEASDPSEGKQPICIYLMKKAVSGKDSESLSFRIGLDGQLEKAFQIQGKNDDDGNPIPGSGQIAEKDIDSPAVRESYTTELKAVKVWLKEQKRLLAKKENADAVKKSASASSSALGKEAAAASTAQ